MASYYTRRKSRLLDLAWSVRPLAWYGLSSIYYTALSCYSIATLAALILRCAGFWLLQGFSVHSLVCDFQSWLFLLSLGLMLPSQSGLSWPLISSVDYCNPFSTLYLIQFIIMFVYQLYPPLVPWEEGPYLFHSPMYFMVPSKNNHSNFEWMDKSIWYTLIEIYYLHNLLYSMIKRT